MDNPLSPTFIIGTIHIGEIEGASCFNMGNNWPTNFRSFKKHSQGFGTVKGSHASITGTKSLLNDPDMIDSPTFAEPELPDWLRRMLQGTASLETEETDDDEGDAPDSDAASGAQDSGESPGTDRTGESSLTGG